MAAKRWNWKIDHRMDAKKLVKGRLYEYVQRDGRRHKVRYEYAGVNSYVFSFVAGNGMLSLLYSVVGEKIVEVA